MIIASQPIYGRAFFTRLLAAGQGSTVQRRDSERGLSAAEGAEKSLCVGRHEGNPHEFFAAVLLFLLHGCIPTPRGTSIARNSAFGWFCLSQHCCMGIALSAAAIPPYVANNRAEDVFR